MKKQAFNILKSMKILQTNPHMNEEIKVISSDMLDDIGEGFTRYDQVNIHRLENYSFKMNRSLAEYDSSYRQLVCNIILRCRIRNEIHYGLLRRNDKVNETRLANSIGMIGGHANGNDSHFIDCLKREVSEEISLQTYEPNLIGIIKDSNSKVSMQHLCVLYVANLSDKQINIKSKEANESFIWLPESHIRKYLSEPNSFDSWVRIGLSEIINSDF